MITMTPDPVPTSALSRERTAIGVPRPPWTAPLADPARETFQAGPYRAAIGCSLLLLSDRRTRSEQS